MGEDFPPPEELSRENLLYLAMMAAATMGYIRTSSETGERVGGIPLIGSRISPHYQIFAVDTGITNSLMDTLYLLMLAHGPDIFDLYPRGKPIAITASSAEIIEDISIAIEELTSGTEAWEEVIEQAATRLLALSGNFHRLPPQYLLRQRLADHFYLLWGGGYISSLQDYISLQHGLPNDEQVEFKTNFDLDEERVVVRTLLQPVHNAHQIEALMEVVYGITQQLSAA
jgi:hypothetical protein